MSRSMLRARTLKPLVLVFFLGASTAALLAQTEMQSPVSIIEDAMALLVVGIEGKKDELAADTDSLYALIDDILLPRFARKSAAQRVLGRKYWSSASEDQRSRFIEAFYSSLVRKYADGALEFDQDRIEILPFRGDVTKRAVTVNTKVLLDDGNTISVDYVLINQKGEWKMVDVKIEGVGYLKSFRDQVGAEIKTSSLDAVITRLESEIAGSAT